MPTYLEYLVMGLGVLFAIYSIYLGSLSLAGGWTLWKTKRRDEAEVMSASLPFVSVLVAAKNEANVVPRLVRSLEALLYEASRIEFIIVEDGSTDETYRRLCENTRGDPRFRILHVDNSLGKAGALNQGLPTSRGELIFLLDADCVPQPDLLLKAAAEYRKGHNVMVGYFKIINARQNILTRLAVFEELLWHVMNVGRNRLGLSAPVTGCCTVISRAAFIEAGFMFHAHLAEDAELGLRLLKKGYPGYHLNCYVLQETPSTITALVGQRLRWYRGYLDAVIRNSDVFAHTDFRKAVDSILNFSTPFFALFTMLSLVLSIVSIPQAASSLTLFAFVAGFVGANLASLLLMGLGLALVSGNDPEEMVKLTPLVYLYTALISVTSVVAVFQWLFRWQGSWTKTVKSGYADVPLLEPIPAA
jgi:cellulose synthase/poly-beta-1,6-N-acetylglucosamine synthase-like glycosyltransferase